MVFVTMKMSALYHDPLFSEKFVFLYNVRSQNLINPTWKWKKKSRFAEHTWAKNACKNLHIPRHKYNRAQKTYIFNLSTTQTTKTIQPLHNRYRHKTQTKLYISPDPNKTKYQRRTDSNAKYENENKSTIAQHNIM